MAQKHSLFFRNFKYAYQRITRGYADIDIWDFDYYLSYIISNGAKHLADTTCSHPIDKTYEEWQEYLREMASHFDKMIELQENFEDPTAEFAEGMKMLQDIYLDLWD